MDVTAFFVTAATFGDSERNVASLVTSRHEPSGSVAVTMSVCAARAPCKMGRGGSTLNVVTSTVAGFGVTAGFAAGIGFFCAACAKPLHIHNPQRTETHLKLSLILRTSWWDFPYTDFLRRPPSKKVL